MAAEDATQASSGALLRGVAEALASRCIGTGAATLDAFDAAAQDHLNRQDEIATLVDSVRLEIQHTTDVAFASLLNNAKELSALFAVIDRTEESVNRAHGAAKAAAERLEVLQSAWEGASGGDKKGLAKVTALFRMSSASNARASDAPVRLPPYEPARVDVAGEMAAIRAAVGDAAAVEAAREAVAAARAAQAQAGAAGAAAGGAGAGAHEFSVAEPDEAEEPAATGSSSAAADGVAAADPGSGSAASDGVGEAAPAVGAPAPSPSPKAALARGEDDSDEEDDDEEDDSEESDE